MLGLDPSIQAPHAIEFLKLNARSYKAAWILVSSTRMTQRQVCQQLEGGATVLPFLFAVLRACGETG